MSDETPDEVVDRWFTLLRTLGATAHGEPVSERDHALQCALVAEEAGASGELIAAALLHDLGHLLAPVPARASDDRHDALAAEALRPWLPSTVTEPIALHVVAKRYLCQAVPGYYDRLSSGSKASLELQGGPLSPAAAADFATRPAAPDAVSLRRWDDAAKEPGRAVPELEEYRPLLVTLIDGNWI